MARIRTSKEAGPAVRRAPLKLSVAPIGRLDRPYVDGLRALVARLRLVLHARALRERAVAVRVDVRVVDEEVLRALVGRYEPEALLVAEPLDRASCHAFLHGIPSCAASAVLLLATARERPHCFRRAVAPAQLGAPY